MKLKIISLNLWWGGQLLPAALEFLRSQSGDVVALQEVHDGHGPGLLERQRTMEILRENLSYSHDDFAQAFVQQAPEGNIPLGNAVLSRVPIKQRSIRFFVEPTREIYQDVPEQWPIFPRLLQHVQLDSPAGEINLFNIHGVWDMDGDNFSDERRRMSETILQATAGLSNVILCGDTNAKPTNPAMRAIEERLKPVFGDELKTTFNMRRKTNPGYATAAVDLMYVSPDIHILAKDCPDVDISDHLPLVVTLQID